MYYQELRGFRSFTSKFRGSQSFISKVQRFIEFYIKSSGVTYKNGIFDNNKTSCIYVIYLVCDVNFGVICIRSFKEM